VIGSQPEPPWLKVYQMPWDSRISDRDLPMWLRIYCIAFARAEPNLHANFQPGELAKMLGQEKSGELRPVHRANLRREIRTAVQKGYLADGSTARCLLLPASDVGCNLSGKWKPCPICTGKSSAPKRPRRRKVTTDRESREMPANVQFTASDVVALRLQVQSPGDYIPRVTPGSRDIFTVVAGAPVSPPAAADTVVS
jgi:hypothetical protein